jgi:hypothetical protein
MASPEQLSDGSAHRIADGDCAIDSEHLKNRSRIVSAVFKFESTPTPNALTVTTMIHRNHVELALQ